MPEIAFYDDSSLVHRTQYTLEAKNVLGTLGGATESGADTRQPAPFVEEPLGEFGATGIIDREVDEDDGGISGGLHDGESRADGFDRGRADRIDLDSADPPSGIESGVQDAFATRRGGSGRLDGRFASPRGVNSSDQSRQGCGHEGGNRRLGLQWMPVEETGVP